MLKKKSTPNPKAKAAAPTALNGISAATAVRVPKPVLDGINAARESGQVNMETRTAVVIALRRLGHWVYAHPSDYADGLVRGFEAEG